MQLQCEVDISQLGPHFKDSNDLKVDTDVMKLPSEFEVDPTVNKSKMDGLVRLVAEHGNKALSFFLSFEVFFSLYLFQL